MIEHDLEQIDARAFARTSLDLVGCVLEPPELVRAKTVARSEESSSAPGLHFHAGEPTCIARQEIDFGVLGSQSPRDDLRAPSMQLARRESFAESPEITVVSRDEAERESR